jgi:hypothetical protein
MVDIDMFFPVMDLASRANWYCDRALVIYI